MKMRMRYDSEEALRVTETIMQVITYTAYRTSVELAKEKNSEHHFIVQAHFDRLRREARQGTIPALKQIYIALSERAMFPALQALDTIVGYSPGVSTATEEEMQRKREQEGWLWT